MWKGFPSLTPLKKLSISANKANNEFEQKCCKLSVHSQLYDVAIAQHCSQCHGPVQFDNRLEHIIDAVPSRFAVLNELHGSFVCIHGLLPFRKLRHSQGAVREMTHKSSTGCHAL